MYVTACGHRAGEVTLYTHPSGDTAAVTTPFRRAAPPPLLNDRCVFTLHPVVVARARRSHCPSSPPHSSIRAGPSRVALGAARSCA